MADNVDDQLAQLMSLGFDISVCSEALLQTGNVQAATEWILDRQNRQGITPVLRLSDQAINSSPYTGTQDTRAEARVVSRHDEQEAARLREKSAKMALESKRAKRQEKEARNKILQEIKEDREYKKLIHGATHVSPGRQTRETESARLQEEIKRQKRLDKEARARALENIRQDRQAKRESAAATNPRQDASTAVPPANTENDRTSKALIQFRLSDGSTVRQTFNADTTLQEMFAFVRTKDQSGQPLFFTVPYPRRVFAESDGHLTAQEAGFVPNVSLIVSHTDGQSMTSSSTAFRDPAPTRPEPSSPMYTDTSEGEEGEEGEEDEDIEDMDQDIPAPTAPPNLFTNQPAINPHRPAPSARRIPLARRGRVGNPNWNWGTTGHRLTDGPPAEPGELQQGHQQQHQQSTDERQVDEGTRRSALLSAIENRAARQQVSNDMPAHKGKARPVQSLRDTCIETVAGFLSQPTIDAQRRLRNLIFASSKVGELLLRRLEETRKLERSSMKRLAGHCYLQNVILDSYVYATDSLLEELGMCMSASSITKLSLKGCDVITDAGIKHIEGLRNLEYLDASNCKLTDKGLQYLTRLPQLRYLNLSKTKVTDRGLFFLVQHAHFKEVLEALLLDGCTSIKSNDVLDLINSTFPNLLHVSLASTGIQQQMVFSSRCNMQQLEILEVSNTGIGDEEIIRIICCFKRLRELKLGGCEQISARGLAFLPRDLRRLEMVQFPNRVQELDTVLARYAGLRLRHLDLTSMLQITDEATESIASMTSLQYLSLSGTRVTDEGVTRLAGLVNLTKLFLDRTAVSDTGLSKLIGLAKLDTLSLSRTQISNASLCLLGDFERCAFARNLRTLNLSQCALVSDRGVKGLQGAVNLTNLNLDHTQVSKQCLRYLKDLEHLKPVRLLGIEREETLDDDEV